MGDAGRMDDRVATFERLADAGHVEDVADRARDRDAVEVGELARRSNERTDAVASRSELLRDPRSDEPRRARDEHLHEPPPSARRWDRRRPGSTGPARSRSSSENSPPAAVRGT